MKTEWQIRKLKEVCKKGSSNLSFKKVKEDSGDYPVYGAKGFINNISTYHQEKEYISIIKDGAGIGRIELREPKSSVIGTLQYLLPTEEIDIHYLYYFLMGIDFVKYSQGAAIPHIYFRDYGEEEILVPPLPIQKKIVEVLDSAFEKIAKAKENSETNLNNAKEVFESYLQKVFENKGEDWEEKELNEVYDVRDGTHDSPKYQKEGYPLVTSKNLKNGEITFDKIKYISEEDYISINKRSKVDMGDILFAMIGTIGNPVVIKKEPRFAIKNVALFKVPKNQNSYFLKYCLDSKQVIDKMLSEAKGSTQQFVGLGYLRNFKIRLPLIEEQKAIVSKLDNISEQTKQLENIYSQKLSCLEELKQSILQKAFKGELTEVSS